jgi:hypothetical protein
MTNNVGKRVKGINPGISTSRLWRRNFAQKRQSQQTTDIAPLCWGVARRLFSASMLQFVTNVYEGKKTV